MIEKMIGFF